MPEQFNDSSQFDMSEQDQKRFQNYLLESTLNLENPDVRIGTEVGIGAADRKTLNTLSKKFEFDPNGQSIKTEELHGGIKNNGFLEELHSTKIQGVFLKLVFNSTKGLEGRRPSAMSLIRLNLEEGK